MPELPEVHTVVNDLKQAGLIGRSIMEIQVNWAKTVAIPDLLTFVRQLQNQKIVGLGRRGKYLLFHLSNHYTLLAHLRMTGRLLLVPEETPYSPYIRLTLFLDNGMQLRFHDTRKFGRWYLVKDQNEVLHKIGPEPLEEAFSLSLFETMMMGKRRALKPLLLDQSFIAGLGNIYVDEALWEAYLHPLQMAHTLNKKDLDLLHQGIQHVLQRGINSQGTTLGKGRTNFYRLEGQRGSHQTLLKVFRRTGLPCERCGTLIERIVVAQRSTHYCPNCQKLKN